MTTSVGPLAGVEDARYARRRLMLSYLDPTLESLYQERVGAAQLAGLRSGVAAAVGLWLLAAVLVPLLTGAAVGPVLVICLGMAGANLVGFAATRRAGTLDRQQLIGVTLNVLAAAAVLALASLTTAEEWLAVPALMLISIFAFVVLRVRFTAAVAAAIAYLLTFLVFAWAAHPPDVVLSLFILVSAIGVGCGATYLIEDGDRALFTQRLVNADLRAQVERLFRQYLSPDVASTLMRDPSQADLGGEVVEVTVLFADLQGFTPYSERTPPTEIVALLNAYYEAAVPAVLEEGGTVIQFMGDAVMALFNAPQRQPDHALRAARAAIRMRSAVESIAAAAPGRPHFRIGLNTGEDVVGNVGSAQIRNFTAIGDTTNVAARLQTYAQPGTIVVSGRTRELLGDRASVRPLGTPALKGKSAPVEVFELLELRDAGPGRDEQAP